MKITLAALHILLTCSAFCFVTTARVEPSKIETAWEEADLVLCGRVDKLEAIYDDELLRGYTIRLSVARIFKGKKEEKIEFQEELFITPPHPSNRYSMFGHYVVFLKKKNEASGYDELFSVAMSLDGDMQFDPFLEPDSIQEQMRRFILTKAETDSKMERSNKAEVATP